MVSRHLIQCQSLCNIFRGGQPHFRGETSAGQFSLRYFPSILGNCLGLSATISGYLLQSQVACYNFCTVDTVSDYMLQSRTTCHSPRLHATVPDYMPRSQTTCHSPRLRIAVSDCLLQSQSACCSLRMPATVLT